MEGPDHRRDHNHLLIALDPIAPDMTPSSGPDSESQDSHETGPTDPTAPEPVRVEQSSDVQPATDGQTAPDSEDGGLGEALTPSGPLEPQEIDLENAAFVVLGAGLVVGGIALAIAGL
jgi:hypothetical protein